MSSIFEPTRRLADIRERQASCRHRPLASLPSVPSTRTFPESTSGASHEQILRGMWPTGSKRLFSMRNELASCAFSGSRSRFTCSPGATDGVFVILHTRDACLDFAQKLFWGHLGRMFGRHDCLLSTKVLLEGLFDSDCLYHRGYHEGWSDHDQPRDRKVNIGAVHTAWHRKEHRGAFPLPLVCLLCATDCSKIQLWARSVTFTKSGRSSEQGVRCQSANYRKARQVSTIRTEKPIEQRVTVVALAVTTDRLFTQSKPELAKAWRLAPRRPVDCRGPSRTETPR